MIATNGPESSLVIDVAFWVIAVSGILAAIAVVFLKDLFRASLFLVISFLSVAGLFVLLRAEFLAIVQILIYVGAISVLIIFAVLTTRDIQIGNLPNQFTIPAGLLVIIFLIVSVFVMLNTEWNSISDSNVMMETSDQLTLVDGPNDTGRLGQTDHLFGNTVRGIAELLLRDYVLAFEIASVLLLTALIGALALVREGEDA